MMPSTRTSSSLSSGGPSRGGTPTNEPTVQPNETVSNSNSASNQSGSAVTARVATNKDGTARKGRNALRGPDFLRAQYGKDTSYELLGDDVRCSRCSKDSLPCYRKRGSKRCISCASGPCAFSSPGSATSSLNKPKLAEALGSLSTLLRFLEGESAKSVLADALDIIRSECGL
ncbi:hypothetical protein JCM24511_05719 [Saitozyma sp. JCM 24511]|nr:hypothetical protein JCM24511_05719 [Saitozyma sp. JCM 24511]